MAHGVNSEGWTRNFHNPKPKHGPGSLTKIISFCQLNCKSCNNFVFVLECNTGALTYLTYDETRGSRKLVTRKLDTLSLGIMI